MVHSLTRNHQDTDDLVQETFLQAYRAIRKFRQHASFYTWLYRIAANLTLNFLKRSRPEKKRWDTELEQLDMGRERAFTDPEVRSHNQELRQRLAAAIDSLPPKYRLTFVLVEKQGLSHKQASLVLRCTEKTVSWRMFKAREMLQNRLEVYLTRGLL